MKINPRVTMWLAAAALTAGTYIEGGGNGPGLLALGGCLACITIVEAISR